ncbi:MAG TPA: PEP/pyruvate-binding domain-containing protein [Streptosporangiales bacterium]
MSSTTGESALVMGLADPAAELATVGGKGASLARLAAAGLPVPPGFHVTTTAYVDFAARLHDAVLAAMGEVDADTPATFETASARIRALFAGHEMPQRTAEAIAKAYAELGGDDVAVAVRSSATAEDLPDMSFAGQQDTYLNVRGQAALLEAVRRCWASLWTARAIGYRARNGIAPDGIGLAVVVQELVAADAAGVMFTADPVTGSRDTVLVNAAWGLGEAVVGGQVTPDAYAVDRSSTAVVRSDVADKTVMTVRTDTGTEERPVPEDRRAQRVLADDQVVRLAGIGLRIEALYGVPMDVEWAMRDGSCYVVQARPITNLGSAGAPTETWNDSLDGDYLWSNGNVGEAIPDVMTPISWSFIKIFFDHAMPTSSVPGYLGYGRIGGRFYMNLSMAAALAGAVGISMKRFRTLTEPVFGKLPPGVEIPRVPLPRLRLLRLLVPRAVRLTGDVRRHRGRLPEYLASAAERSERLRARIAAVGDPCALADMWRAEIEPYLVEASTMLAVGTRSGGVAVLNAPKRLRRLVGEADATALVSGQRPGEANLASLGQLVGLAQLARGEIDRATFARRYGHRSVHEFEVSYARPGEDPAWIDRQLAAVRAQEHGVDELLARQEAARAAAWERLAHRRPRDVARARRWVAQWAKVARARENTRSEVIRSFWVLRAYVLRAAELTGRGDDLFFLSLEELLDVLRGSPAALAAVPGRRATYEHYRSLPAYPALIRGRFDPDRWAADPDRRTDFYDVSGPQAPVSDTVTGFPGAAGVVEGVARVVPRVEDADELAAGEVLVTTVTNIGWTPVFPRAAAVVTDVGAPLSHAAIVARELGIPAVVGCGNATMRLHTGDRVRVDGGRGTVEVLAPGG